MKSRLTNSATRLALAAGCAAGLWLVPSISPAEVGAALPSETAPAKQAGEGVLLAQADATPVERPVSYTSDQADRGKKRYEAECLDCHGDDLKGGMNGGAPLRGLAFDDHFGNGAPASALFTFMSTMMPPNAPGRYSPAVYADMMAYILKRNGYQEGAELPSDSDALDYLIMEK